MNINIKFELYSGTKTIKARPMTGEQFIEERVPDRTGSQSGPGYLVGYPDAKGEFNGPLEGGCEYISWSPEDVFEAAYSQDK